MEELRMKHRLFLLGATALSLLFSCSRAEFEPMDSASGNEKTGRTVLEATAAGDLTPDSKTSFGDKTGNAYPILWSAGDCISVNGVASEELASGGTTTAKFTFDGILDAPFQGVYPASAVNAYFNGEYSVSVPSGQTYTPGQFDPAAGLMLASGSSNLTFKHVMAYLKVTVAGSGSEKIQFISVAARGDENLSGTFAPVFGETPSLTGGADGNDVTLDCGTEGVALGTEFIIPIPARTLASGLTVTVRTTDKKYCVMESTSAFTPVAGKIYNTSFAYSEKGSAVGIWTEEELVAFLNAADGDVACDSYYQKNPATVNYPDPATWSEWVASDGRVHIYADITLRTKIDWSGSAPATRSCTVSNFNGYLDGEGHSITVDPETEWITPFFINLYGTVANLTLNGSFRVGHAASLCAPLVNVVQAGACLDNITSNVDVAYSYASSTSYLALSGIAGFMHAATISNCTYKGTITAAGNAGLPKSGSPVHGIGGVVGYVYEGSTSARGTVIGCNNYGTINVSTVRNTNGSYIMPTGGVVGYIANYNDVSGCNNYAALNTGTSQIFGGVISSSRGEVYDCHNWGEITQDADNKTTTFGGVIEFMGSGHTVSGCTNNATIKVGGAHYAGGVICRCYGTLTDCVNNGEIICDQDSCSVAGVVLNLRGTGVLRNCENNGNITVTGNNSAAGGVCFYMLSNALISDCSNSGNIRFTLTPAVSNTIAFAGGIVAMVGAHSYMDGGVTPPYMVPADLGTNKNYSPTTKFSDNTLSSLTTIRRCVNTGEITFATTESSTTYLRNVAIGGIVGWNWAKTTANAYLRIVSCTNGAANSTYGRLNYEQTISSGSTPPSYSSQAIGGILGCSAPYVLFSAGSAFPYTPGASNSSNLSTYDFGYKAAIDSCQNYGRIWNLASYSNGVTTRSNRALRPCGGIAGAVYGKSNQRVSISNCSSSAYVAMGASTEGGSSTQKARQSYTNSVGGIVGIATFVDVDKCSVSSSANDTFGVGSESRYVMAAGGVFGTVQEKFTVTNCTVHMRMGYYNSKSLSNYGLIVGSVIPTASRSSYDTLMGSEISNNKIMPGVVKVNGSSLTINSDNFTDYLISAEDAADNATNKWLTISGNTWE